MVEGPRTGGTGPEPDFPDLIPAGAHELRRLRPGGTPADVALVEAVDATVPENEITETFRFFRQIPAGGGRLRSFLADFPGRDSATYGVVDADSGRAIGCTSLYDWDLEAGTCMIGWTWLSPSARGTGANTQVKEALFAALRRAGFSTAVLRADVENERSVAAMRKVGARDGEIEDAPRSYPWDPSRVSRSQFFLVDL